MVSIKPGTRHFSAQPVGAGVTLRSVVSDDVPGEEDYASAYRAMAYLEAAGWRKATLNERVAAWEAFVSEVEQGYGMTVDDYTNDLAVREWLTLALPMLTPRLQSSLVKRLEPLDERFMRATVTLARRLPGAGASWHYRLPRVLTGELAEDAERMGLRPGQD
jgi:hypothetical protein